MCCCAVWKPGWVTSSRSWLYKQASRDSVRLYIIMAETLPTWCQLAMWYLLTSKQLKTSRLFCCQLCLAVMNISLPTFSASYVSHFMLEGSWSAVDSQWCFWVSCNAFVVALVFWNCSSVFCADILVIKFTHSISPLLSQLHWLKTSEQINYKVTVLAYKC